MMKMVLKFIKVNGSSGYITADNGKEIFCHTETTKIQAVTVEEDTVIYYSNGYNIFSKTDNNGNNCGDSFVKILSIKNNLVEFEKQSSRSEKTFINKGEPVLRKKFKLHIGETFTIVPIIKDASVIYTFVVDNFIKEN